jgi:carbamoyltransferase
MNIIGFSAYYHDSAAALIKNGEIITAVQEERFSRIKHDSSFPEKSIKYILETNNLKINEIDAFVFYEKPFIKFERLLETYVCFAPKGLLSFLKSIPLWIKEKLFQKKLIIDELKKIQDITVHKDKIFFSEHHLSHAASAFYPSNYKEALILTIDGVGEWSTTTISLGLLYSAFTMYLGFKVNSGEYKIMGLAPYGTPKYVDTIYNHLIDVKDDGSFRLNLKYFDYATGLKMINNQFSKLFGKNPRVPETEELTQFHMDVAASIQKVIEDILIKILKFFSNETKIRNLCMAGGVALNCVANGKIYEEHLFKNIWVQPASGDAGNAIGSALAYWHLHLKKENIIIKDKFDKMKGSYLGTSYSNDEILKTLDEIGAKYSFFSDENELIKCVAKNLKEEKAVGWFHGKMEFGPRALGSRSILGNPLSKNMQKNLNLKIKFRESFRPFAPAIIYEELEKWFKFNSPSPYMMFVSQIKEEIKLKLSKNEENLFGVEKLNAFRSKIPSVTHVDYSARLQTVHNETNPRFYKLIKEFKNISGCPILINTSFNIRGEPIVCDVEDAFKCFMGTNLDILVCENFVMLKKDQDVSLKVDYRQKFKLD